MIPKVKDLSAGAIPLEDLISSVQNSLNNIPVEQRNAYQDFEIFFNKMIEQGSLDYSVLQTFIDWIIQLHNSQLDNLPVKNTETQVIK